MVEGSKRRLQGGSCRKQYEEAEGKERGSRRKRQVDEPAERGGCRGQQA